MKKNYCTCELLSMFLQSSTTLAGENKTEDILKWIDERNKGLAVNITKIPLVLCTDWFYDEMAGTIHNVQNSFFSIIGYTIRNETSYIEQPIILQKEIGYLGILCKPIDGVLHFLMQAKIEPGNINYIQISPTIQATKSNFTQKHGGKKPEYLDYFLNATPESILVDQNQSEQSSRFLGKRNRNIIVILNEDEDVEVIPSHRWMTLGQIKKLMRYDNLVNMDTRTVLSCIPYSLLPSDNNMASTPLMRSVFKTPSLKDIVAVYRYINNYKMFDDSEVNLISLMDMINWEMRGCEYVCKEPFPFKLIFCDIEIEGREVRRWCQPLFEAVGKAIFGLIYCDDLNNDGIKRFLVKLTPEIGCFDKIELGPSIQQEAGQQIRHDAVSGLFYDRLNKNIGIHYDYYLSEEGGRFYHEENRNILMEIRSKDIGSLPEEYKWLDYSTLNHLCMVNNCLNIQLRNLLSLIEIRS